MLTSYSYEMTKALVAERQATFAHEARQHRLGRLTRRSRRGRQASGTTPRSCLPAAPTFVPRWAYDR